MLQSYDLNQQHYFRLKFSAKKIGIIFADFTLNAEQKAQSFSIVK